ncbi:MAG: hypothetical protein ABI643_04270 [Candidatus Doudnabacteria bacterium]
MRFVAVLADATEEDAVDFFENRITIQEPAELLVVHHLTGTAEFVRAEIDNKRAVDGIFFLCANVNMLTQVFQIGVELKNHPMTNPIDWLIIVDERTSETLYIDAENFPSIPHPLLNMMRKKREDTKLPN